MEYLISILSNGLYPCFCLEDTSAFEPTTTGLREVAQPMCCFCDIPLSMIHHHIHKYGSYGIGLTKEWGMAMGIAPVVYVYPHASTSDLLRLILFKAFLYQAHIDNEKLDDVVGPIHILKNYFKAVEGRMYKNGNYTDEKYYFYDEREWRYIPFGKLTELAVAGEKVRVFLTRQEFDNPTVREFQNLVLADHCSLSFRPSDVRYIFVPEEPEVEDVIQVLEGEGTTQWSGEEVSSLSRRVVSMQELLRDV
jgi:hypothetical protein